MKDKILYIYYFVLMLALALYTNMNASPNIVIRLGYLAAMIIPLLKKVELFPAIIVCALGISKNTFAYPLMPTDIVYYIVLTLGFAFISLYHRDYTTNINPLFYYALIYVALNDISMLGGLSQMTIMFFICILFYLCVEEDIDIGCQYLPLAFILISLTISFWAIFFPEAQTNTYNKVGEVEQIGWTDPNYLSVALGTGLVVAVKDLFKGGNKQLYTLISCLTILGSSIALLLLASRGAILSVIFATTVFIVISKTSIRTKVIAFVAAVILILYLYTNNYLDFVMARFEQDDSAGGHNRTEIWLSKINDFYLLDNPLNWIFGVGQFEGEKLGKFLGSSVSGVSTHNDFLSILIYYGFLGVCVFLCIITYPLRICSKEELPYIIALLVYLLACSMTIEPLAHGNFVYWGFLFYIIVLARNSQELELIDEEGEEIETEFDADGQE